MTWATVTATDVGARQEDSSDHRVNLEGCTRHTDLTLETKTLLTERRTLPIPRLCHNA